MRRRHSFKKHYGTNRKRAGRHSRRLRSYSASRGGIRL